MKQNEYTDMNLCTTVIPKSILEINKIEINDKTLQLPTPSVTGNLRPSDKIRKDFPPLPYSAENQQFIKKVNFEYSDLTDTDYVNLCNILINNQNCYAKHKNDVGKIFLLPSELELKITVNSKHKDLLKYQYITEIDSKNFY